MAVRQNSVATVPGATVISNFQEEAAVLAAIDNRFKFPSTYLVLDTETTGFSRSKDFMVDAGWAVVIDNQIVNNTSLLLNWSLMPNVDHDFIKSQLRKQAFDYAKIGRPYYYSWERLCDEGVHPLEVIHAYSTLIYDHIQNDSSMIVGHGLWRFDRDVIDSHTQRFLGGYLLPWQMHSIMDTGIIEKAVQTDRTPWVGDTLDEWLRRTNNAFLKAKWNLEGHCVPKYRLVERYNIDMRFMHTAGFDCVLTSHLLDTYRQLMETFRGQTRTNQQVAS